ncbi:MAG: hypothetical protein RBR97_13245 [Bacteroidales bacterium]|nr:hypothetical protein [Bacteroidales bacterium]
MKIERVMRYLKVKIMRLLFLPIAIKRTVRGVFFILSLGILAISCHKEEPLDQDVSKTLIEESRTFYDIQMSEINSSMGIKGQHQIPKRNPKWEKAAVMPLSMGNGVVAPLDFEDHNFVRTTISPYDMPLEDASYLMMYKNEDGAMQGEIVYLLPDGQSTETKSGQKSDFSGTIIVQNLQGDIKKGYIHNPDGSITGFLPADSLPSKSSTCFTFEIWQIKSSDGGDTWSSPELISSHTECFGVTLPSMETGDGGGGGGGYDDYVSGGGGTSGTTTQPTSRPLTSTEKSTLNQLKSQLSTDCANGKVVSKVWNGMKFAVNGSISTPAQWDLNSNTITFQSGNFQFTELMEELFHAYQNTVYPGGIGKYSQGKPGNTNIEFEAKLFKDIYTALYGGAWNASIGFPDSYMKLYQDWVFLISEEGFTPALMGQYNTMLGYFNQYSHGYGGYLLSSLNTPLAIIQSKSGCN